MLLKRDKNICLLYSEIYSLIVHYQNDDIDILRYLLYLYVANQSLGIIYMSEYSQQFQ